MFQSVRAALYSILDSIRSLLACNCHMVTVIDGNDSKGDIVNFLLYLWSWYCSAYHLMRIIVALSKRLATMVNKRANITSNRN